MSKPISMAKCCDLEVRVLTCGTAVLSIGDKAVNLREAQVKRLAQMLGEALYAMMSERGGNSGGYLH